MYLKTCFTSRSYHPVTIPTLKINLCSRLVQLPMKRKYPLNEYDVFTHSLLISLQKIVFVITFDPAAPNHRNKICMNVVSGGFSLQVRKDKKKETQVKKGRFGHLILVQPNLSRTSIMSFFLPLYICFRLSMNCVNCRCPSCAMRNVSLALLRNSMNSL